MLMLGDNNNSIDMRLHVPIRWLIPASSLGQTSLKTCQQVKNEHIQRPGKKSFLFWPLFAAKLHWYAGSECDWRMPLETNLSKNAVSLSVRNRKSISQAGPYHDFTEHITSHVPNHLNHGHPQTMTRHVHRERCESAAPGWLRAAAGCLQASNCQHQIVSIKSLISYIIYDVWY